MIEQSKLNKLERLENIKNVYAVKNVEKIKNKRIVLFDDIYTTRKYSKGMCKNVKISRRKRNNSVNNRKRLK